MNLLVAKRQFRFAGATLRENERFFARAPMARMLKAMGRAEDAPDIPQFADVVQRAVEEVGAERDDDLTALRNEYETRMGKKPDGRWKAPRLREELGRYQRRDMRAEG